MAEQRWSAIWPIIVALAGACYLNDRVLWQGTMKQGHAHEHGLVYLEATDFFEEVS